MSVQPKKPRGGEREGGRKDKKEEKKGGEEKGIKILQVNCRRSTIIMQVAMEVGKECNIIAIQEPWFGKNGKTIDLTKYAQTVEHQGYDIIHQGGEGKWKARVMWMIKRERRLEYRVRGDRWKNEDASVLNVQTNKGKIRIVNIYNAKSPIKNNQQGWCIQRLPEGIAKGQPTLIIGDFNAHSRLWDSSVTKEVRDKLILEAMERENMTLINAKNIPTYRSGKVKSVLDLAWITAKDWDQTSWELRKQDEVGSDHAAILITMGKDQEMCTNPTQSRWNVKEARWGEVREEMMRRKEEKKEEWERKVKEEDSPPSSNKAWKREYLL